MMKFKTEVIVSVVTGRLYCNIDEIYKLLNFLTDDNLFTHQLPRASYFCKPFLYSQFLWLYQINFDEYNTKNWRGWIKDIISKVGEEFEVDNIQTLKEWKYISPINELINMRGGKNENIFIM